MCGSSLSPPLQHDSLAHRPGHRSKVHVTVHSLSDIVVTEDRSLARYRIARGPDIESPQRGPAPRYPRANPAKISRAMIARGAPETLGSGHSHTHRAIRRNAGGNAHGACDGTRTSAPRAVHSSAVRCRERTYCMWLRLTRSTPRSWVLACRCPQPDPTAHEHGEIQAPTAPPGSSELARVYGVSFKLSDLPKEAGEGFISGFVPYPSSYLDFKLDEPRPVSVQRAQASALPVVRVDPSRHM